MSDDIVTRIREHLYGEPTKTSEFLLKLAANEIERLRNALEQCEAERDTWRTVAETEHIRFTNELKAVSPIQAGIHHPEIGGSIV